MNDIQQAPKYKVGPNMRAPADAKPQSAPPPPTPPVDVAVMEKPDPWHPMEALPKDHLDRAKVGYVYLRGDPYAEEEGHDVDREWYWYVTRQFRKGSFQQTGWWRRRFGPATPPGFTPTGWRLVKDGPL